MPRGKRYSIDEGELLRLYEQEQLSQYEIAHRLGIPRSSVRNRLAKFIQPVQVAITAAGATNGSPAVDATAPPPKRAHWTRVLGALRTEQGQQALRELLAWWQERHAAMAHASEASQPLARFTFQVEPRWVDAIMCKADVDGMTISRVVNEALRAYFTRGEGYTGTEVSTSNASCPYPSRCGRKASPGDNTCTAQVTGKGRRAAR